MTTARTPEQEALYQQFLAEATEMITEMNRRVSEQGNKETNFCVSGCTACCNQVFYISSLEFEVILARLVSDPELRRKFDKQSARRKALMEEKDETIKELSQITDTEEFVRKWVSLKIPCALLDEDKCMVYEVRPSNCSTYFTLSPPRVCAIDPRGYMSNEMRRLNNDFGLAILAIAKKYGISNDHFFDLSSHLDQRLNPPQEEKKKRRKKS